MDIVFNPAQWREQARARSGQPARLDWHGLAARLVAADACRRALAGGRAVPTGSFDSALARGIAAHPEAAGAALSNGSQAAGEGRVNPVGSAVGKADGPSKASIDGREEPGDRGWQ